MPHKKGQIGPVGSMAGSALGRIAEKSSGARLSGKLYREWVRKVRRHDQLEKAMAAIVAHVVAERDGIDGKTVLRATDCPVSDELAQAALDALLFEPNNKVSNSDPEKTS